MRTGYFPALANGKRLLQRLPSDAFISPQFFKCAGLVGIKRIRLLRAAWAVAEVLIWPHPKPRFAAKRGLKMVPATLRDLLWRAVGGELDDFGTDIARTVGLRSRMQRHQQRICTLGEDCVEDAGTDFHTEHTDDCRGLCRVNAEIAEKARAASTFHRAHHAEHRVLLWNNFLAGDLAQPRDDGADGGIRKMLGHSDGCHSGVAAGEAGPLPVARVQRDVKNAAFLPLGMLFDGIEAVGAEVFCRQRGCPEKVEHRAREIAVAGADDFAIFLSRP